MKKFIIILFITSCGYEKTAEPIAVTEDSISAESLNLRDSISASIYALDSLRPVVQKTVAQLKYYEELKQSYEQQEAVIIRETKVDSSAIITLRSKLTAANNEISRLNGELASLQYKRYDQPVREALTYTQPAIITPDNNSLIISLDGSSRKGNIPIPDNLTIYLIPYTRALKKELGYDLSCAELMGSPEAKYYGGLYFFNSVGPGKYVIKICTYFGDYKIINKPEGKYSIKMQISPPIQ